MYKTRTPAEEADVTRRARDPSVIADWQAATRDGDLPRVLALMADDVVYLTAGQLPFGKEQFATAFQAMLDRDVRIESNCEIREVQVSGDLAYGWSTSA